MKTDKIEFYCCYTGSVVTPDMCKQHFALTERKHRMARTPDECRAIWERRVVADTKISDNNP